MNQANKYRIQVKGLPTGVHEYDFTLDKSFFQEREYSDIPGGQVDYKITLNNQNPVWELHFSLSGVIQVTCDRCLDLFNLPVSGEHSLFLKTGDDFSQQDDDVILIPENDNEVDIGHFMYEFVVLSLPYKRVHPLDQDGNTTCNSEMLKRLQNFEVTNTDTNTEESTDPRWDDLKKLLNNN